MAAPKGHKRYGGRQKGTPNKLNADVKGMILEALNGVGGVRYLQRQADENPTAFMTLVGKVLPTQVNLGDHEGKRLVPTIHVTIGAGPSSPPKAG